MNTNKYFIEPLSRNFDRLLLGFGQDLLERAESIKFKRQEVEMARCALHRDSEIAGAQGIISLIRAMIEEGLHSKKEIIEKGVAVCGPAMADLFEEVLELFDGSDCLRNMWYAMPSGHYRLTTIFEERAAYVHVGRSETDYTKIPSLI